MTAWAKHGRRPAGWWAFEAPLPRPHYYREQSALYEAGLLDAEEARELEAEWREQFERAWQPDFFFCEGPGRFFTGRIARAKHFQWADIPASLVEKWTAERRRQKAAKAMPAA